MYLLVILHLQLAQKKPYLESWLNQLSFDQHVSSMYSKASKKLLALGRIASFMSFEKRRVLLKAVLKSPIQLLSPNMDVSLKNIE